MSKWAFLEAAKQGDISKMRQLLTADRSVVHARDYGRRDLGPWDDERAYDEVFGDNALHLCVYYTDKVEAVRYLLDEAGISIESKGRFSHLPAHYAAQRGHLAVLRYLKSRGANFRELNQFGETILQIAAKYSPNTKIIEYLLNDCQFGVDERCHSEPLLAIGVAVMNYFLNSTYAAQGVPGLTPFLAAIYCGNLAAAQYLVARGADVGALSQHGNSALHVAVMGRGSVETMGYLLRECHFNINARGMDGMTAFMLAAGSGNLSALKYLQFKGADTMLSDSQGNNAFHIAAKYSRNTAMLTHLLDECGFSLDGRGDSGMTAFHGAAREADLEVLKFLHIRGASVHAMDNAGYNALYYAAKYSKSVDVLRYLLEEVGLDFHAIGPEQKTALEIAEAENGWIFKANYSPVVVSFLKGWVETGRSRVRQEASPVDKSASPSVSHQNESISRSAAAPSSLETPSPSSSSSSSGSSQLQTPLSRSGHPSVSSTEPTSTPVTQTVQETGKDIPLKRIALSALDYALTDRVGVGGYGEVYKGTWHGMTVAIKKLHGDDFSAQARDELMQEAALMVHVSAPNIVKLYGVVVEEGPLMMVMEYLPQSLLHVLKDMEVDMSWDQRFSIGLDVGYGMAFLHEQDILHRDLKSDNVLLDHSGQAKLADFGLAKIKSEMASQGTVKGSLAGTLPWIAPEVFEEEETTKRSDVYSYAMTLWEIAKKEKGEPYRFPYESKVKNINTGLVRYVLDKGLREDVPEKAPRLLGL